MKSHYRYLYLGLLLTAAPALQAQSAVDVYGGLGTAHVKAASGGLDTQTLDSCLSGSTCQPLNSLGGLFMGIGGDIMFTDRFGAGAQATFTPAKRDYGPLQYRQLFFDANGLYEPIRHKRAVLQLQAGIGTARTSFAYTATSCVGTAVCTTQSQAIGNSSHFQVHIGAGVQVFVTEHIFVKPQFDYHYVPGLTDQFGGNNVPMFMINVGYGTRR